MYLKNWFSFETSPFEYMHISMLCEYSFYELLGKTVSKQLELYNNYPYLTAVLPRLLSMPKNIGVTPGIVGGCEPQILELMGRAGSWSLHDILYPTKYSAYCTGI